jgi:hypothetical protein
MFPDGERKPGTTAPERPARDDDAVTAAITVATALMLRSEGLIRSLLVGDIPILWCPGNSQVPAA